MKILRNMQTGVVVVALVAAGAMARAQATTPPPGDGPGFGEHRPPMERMLGGASHGRWWNNPTVIDRLKLTDDQRKSMDDILQQHRDTLIDMRANVEKAEAALEPLMGADQPNESAILAQIDRVAQARAELEKANARFLLALRARLTPDQWKGMQAMRNERREAGPGAMHRHDWRNAAPPSGGPETAPPPPADPSPQSLLDDAPFPGPTDEMLPARDAGNIH